MLFSAAERSAPPLNSSDRCHISFQMKTKFKRIRSTRDERVIILSSSSWAGSTHPLLLNAS